MTSLLSNIRVLDLSRILSGPWATQMLADFGADVIKVERPGTGDDVRHQGAQLKDREGHPTAERTVFLALNRGKRSIAIDMASQEGQDLIRRLAATADVVVENFKAGDLARYGLDHVALRAINPRIVYCSISGFGQTGPYSHLPGYDLVFQAMSGLMSLTGVPEGQPGAGPQRTGYPISDTTAGFYASIGILAALHHRDTVSGTGQFIDLAMLDAQVAAMSSMAMSYVVAGEMPQRVGIRSQLTCPYQDFDCADGQVMIAVGNDKQYQQLCTDVLERPDLATDPRYTTTPLRVQNREQLVPVIADILRTRSVDHWMASLRAANVPAGPINDFAQVLNDPQIRHREVLQQVPHTLSGTMPFIGNPLKFSDTPVTYHRGPPLLGEHTAEVLRELLDMDDPTIAALQKQGVVA
ncbi:CoA transferase [Hydrogenophaga sp.]|uniref:CaiB/BaiF CoA transferase family protein n=1 Tax=Hydrogenophaga sp. TaxID=1904254 RepID=UPI002ABC66A7|nr:CoA transferase [Hydrogenophaga sp.]MDZ4400446.1 CoA transferase [Hydrogenophaga sp.]